LANGVLDGETPYGDVNVTMENGIGAKIYLDDTEAREASDIYAKFMYTISFHPLQNGSARF
jgi:hypothetical protein